MVDIGIRTTSESLPATRQRWTLVVSCLAVALVVASMAALYTALPQLATSINATQQQLTWVVNGYTLALAALVLAGGALGDRYGRRKALIVGLVIFCLGTAVPLIVHDPAWLIAGRVISGIGAALVMPSTLSLLTPVFPVERWGFAVGIWAGVAGSGAVVGLLGSGLILLEWSWWAIFAGMTAAGAVLVVAALLVPESRESARPRVDILGTIGSVLTVSLLVIGVTEAPQRGWSSPLTLILLLGALIAGAGFIVVEWRSAHPLLPIRLFASREFSCGATSVGLQFLVNFGVFLLLVQYLQLILGYSPLRSSVAMAPMAIPLVLLSVVSSALTQRLGLRVMTVTGLAAVSCGLFLLTRIGVHTSYIGVMVPLMVASIGLGLCMAPATSAIISSTPAEKHGVASAVNDAAREVGAAIGIAIAGSLLAAGYRDRVQPVLSQLPAPARQPVHDSLAAALAVTGRAGPAARPLAEFARVAFVHGIHEAALVLGVIMACSAVLALAAPGPGRPNRLLARFGRRGRSRVAEPVD